MIEVIKDIILDNQNTDIVDSIPRELKIIPIKNKATICIGVRRCGKSTYMSQHLKKLLQNGVQKENILSINFIDDRLHGLQLENLSLVISAYFSYIQKRKILKQFTAFLMKYKSLKDGKYLLKEL